MTRETPDDELFAVNQKNQTGKAAIHALRGGSPPPVRSRITPRISKTQSEKTDTRTIPRNIPGN